MKQKAFLFEEKRCVGCKACAVACKVKNNLAVGVNFRKVDSFEAEIGGRYVERFISHACMHCADPECARVCPTLAYTKNDEGIVLHDKNLCVGCGYCTYACPYGAISIDPVIKKAVKCDMCVDLIKKGEEPACVRGCPLNILEVHDLNILDRAGMRKETLGFIEFECAPSMRFKG